MGSLQAHEVRINRIVAREDEQAFQTTEDAEPSKRNQYTRGRGRGRYRGRGRGRTNLIYCSHCDKNGHSDDSCWFKQKHTKKKQRNQLPIVSVETSQSHTFNTSNSNKDSNILRCNRRLTNNPSLNPSPSPHDYDVRKTIEVGTTLGYNLTGHEVKLGWHNEDGFITIYGEWVNFGMPCLMIIVYAPQDMNAKCALWNRLVDLIRNFQDICIVLGDFNEVRYAIERIDSTFCKKVAEFFNSFIYNAELIDLPMGGFATKLSKLDRNLVSCQFTSKWPNAQLITLPRDVSDHCPLLHKSHCDNFGPIPTIFSQSWSSTLMSSATTHPAIILKEKLQLMKKHIRMWRSNATSYSDNFKTLSTNELSLLDAPFTSTKIKDAVWDCGGGKVPVRMDLLLSSSSIIKVQLAHILLTWLSDSKWMASFQGVATPLLSL
ncbi:cytochrome P450 [Tanacetum coccineum]